MKALTLLLALLPQLLFAAPFQNLGFDEARTELLAGTPPTAGPTFWLLPGWTVSSSPVGWNMTYGFYQTSSILDVNYRNTLQPANPTYAPVVGRFSLGIWPSSGREFDQFRFILGQTGDIPADAQSLRFLYHGDNLQVSVGGTFMPVHFLEDVASGNPDVPVFHYYAVDVSAFAGQTAELRFEFRSFGNFPGQDAPHQPFWPDAKSHVLDDLYFSPLPAVPEPETWALLGVGLATLLWWQRRR